MSNRARPILVALASAASMLTARAQQATPAAPPTVTGGTIQITGSRERLIMLKPPRPKYPPDAGGISGWVRVECAISPQGLVESVRILESEPAGVFDQAAIDAMKHARFNRSKSAEPRVMVQRLKFEAT